MKTQATVSFVGSHGDVSAHDRIGLRMLKDALSAILAGPANKKEAITLHDRLGHDRNGAVGRSLKILARRSFSGKNQKIL